MNRKQPFSWVIPFITFSMINIALKAQEPVIMDSKMKPGISNDMRIEELKVRWKKAALENCPGAPCVTTAVPGSPNGVIVSVGNASASVAFVAPTNNGGSAITVYTVTSNPGNISATGATSPINLTGLMNGTAYTFTVVATNAVGSSVASSASTAVTPAVCPTSTVTDVDGNIYNTVAIGTQCWTKENLKVTMYNDGTLIPLGDPGSTVFPIGTSTIWQNLTTGAYNIYGNESSTGTNATNYGFLYNWYAAKGVSTIGSTTYKNLCPTGWHVPTTGEWDTLVTQLGGFLVAGGKMKSTGTTLWNSPNTGADNSSGFSAFPGGTRLFFGAFYDVRDAATFWSATEDPVSGVAWFRQLFRVNGGVNRAGNDKHSGYSVRCLKD